MESQTCSRKSRLEKWWGRRGGGNVRKKGVAVDSSAMRGECFGQDLGTPNILQGLGGWPDFRG